MQEAWRQFHSRRPEGDRSLSVLTYVAGVSGWGPADGEQIGFIFGRIFRDRLNVCENDQANKHADCAEKQP